MARLNTSEAVLVEQVIEFYSDKGYRVYLEIPFGGRRIDVFAIHPKSGQIIAVEAKLSHWKRALKQARVCLLCADWVYVALPREYARGVKERGFRGFGVGLLSVGNEVRVEIRASRSPFKRSHHTRQIRETLAMLDGLQ